MRNRQWIDTLRYALRLPPRQRQRNTLKLHTTVSNSFALSVNNSSMQWDDSSARCSCTWSTNKTIPDLEDIQKTVMRHAELYHPEMVPILKTMTKFGIINT